MHFCTVLSFLLHILTPWPCRQQFSSYYSFSSENPVISSNTFDLALKFSWCFLELLMACWGQTQTSSFSLIALSSKQNSTVRLDFHILMIVLGVTLYKAMCYCYLKRFLCFEMAEGVAVPYTKLCHILGPGCSVGVDEFSIMKALTVFI